jgi:hypothetical protein
MQGALGCMGMTMWTWLRSIADPLGSFATTFIAVLTLFIVFENSWQLRLTQ